MHPAQQALRRLPEVLRRLAAHPGSSQPAPEAADKARRLLGTHGAICCITIPSRIWYVTDGGHRHMVATFEYYGQVADFTCSCASQTVCAHLLAVLALHDNDLATPAPDPGRHRRGGRPSACGLVLDRDVNAAANLLHLGPQRANACRAQVRPSPAGHRAAKQEPGIADANKTRTAGGQLPAAGQEPTHAH